MQTPLPSLLEEAQRIVYLAKENDVTLRLIGGMAVRLTSPSAANPPLARSYNDIDLVGRSSETRNLKKYFAYLGYAPRETFNAMQGGKRMIFNDLANRRRVDVFQDYFEMAHKFDLRKRLPLREETLPLVDLLETKLQIVQMNDKDFRDIIALLIDHPLGDADEGNLINVRHAVGLCADDWGVYKTFTSSLNKVILALSHYPLSEADKKVAESRAISLVEQIEKAPKSMKWKLRAKVGERVPWYETPEADAPVIDSRF